MLLARVTAILTLAAAIVAAPARADRIPDSEDPDETVTKTKPADPPDPDGKAGDGDEEDEAAAAKRMERDRDRDRDRNPDPELEHDLRIRMPRQRMKDIVVEIPGERSPANITALVGLGTAALAAGVVGLKFHLDGKTELDAVNADDFTGNVWSDDDQDRVDRAKKDRRRAIVLYSIGGGLLITAIVALIASEPSSTTTTIHPHAAMVVPVDGGAMAGMGWSF